MRTVTMKELDAMLTAVEAVREASAKLGPVCQAIPAVMAASPPAEALRLGITSAAAISEEAERMFQQFERAAYNFLGEKKGPGESSFDYFGRICAMSQSDLLAAPGRNGLRLEL